MTQTELQLLAASIRTAGVRQNSKQKIGNLLEGITALLPKDVSDNFDLPNVPGQCIVRKKAYIMGNLLLLDIYCEGHAIPTFGDIVFSINDMQISNQISGQIPVTYFTREVGGSGTGHVGCLRRDDVYTQYFILRDGDIAAAQNSICWCVNIALSMRQGDDYPYYSQQLGDLDNLDE